MKLAENPFKDALLKCIIFSAIIHMTILIVHFIFTLDENLLNYFDLIGFTVFFPGLSGSWLYTSLSLVFMLAFYNLILLLSKNK